MSSIYFSFFVIISPWKRAWVFVWTDLNPIYPKMRYAKFGRNWVCCSAENDFEFRQYIFANKALHLNSLHLHHRMLYAKFGWNWTIGSGGHSMSSMYFRFFNTISLSIREWPFIWTKLSLLLRWAKNDQHFSIGCYLYLGPGLSMRNIFISISGKDPHLTLSFWLWFQR